MAGGAFDSGYYSNEMSRSNGHKWNNKRPARRMRALIMTARAGTRVWLTEAQQDRAWAASEQRPFRIFPVSLLWIINSAWLLYVKFQVFEVMCRQAPSEFRGGLGSRRSVFTVRQYSPYVCIWTVKESYSYSRTQPFNWTGCLSQYTGRGGESIFDPSCLTLLISGDMLLSSFHFTYYRTVLPFLSTYILSVI